MDKLSINVGKETEMHLVNINVYLLALQECKNSIEVDQSNFN